MNILLPNKTEKTEKYVDIYLPSILQLIVRVCLRQTNSNPAAENFYFNSQSIFPKSRIYLRPAKWFVVAWKITFSF
jgi:hypothetical protein